MPSTINIATAAVPAGTLSNALDAVAWAIGPEGQANNIKVINLSLAAYVPEDDPDRDMTVQYVCSVFQEASDAGECAKWGDMHWREMHSGSGGCFWEYVQNAYTGAAAA